MIQLMSTGSQDAFLTGTPKQTWFVSVFYKNTPFFLNCVEVPFTGLSRYGESTICKIPQTGDVVIGMALQSTLPRLGTPSNVYTYVGPIRTPFSVTYNGTTYQVRIPLGPTTDNVTWLNVIPGLVVDKNLTLTSYNDSALVTLVSGPTLTTLTYNSASDSNIQFNSVDEFQGLDRIVTANANSQELEFTGYSAVYPPVGFLSRDPKYLVSVSGLTRPDPALQPDVPAGQVYGPYLTWQFQRPKNFTQLTITLPVSSSPLSLAQVPGWVFVFGSNNGSTWSLAGDPQRGSTIRLYGNSWYRFRVLVASAGTSSFLASSFVFYGSASATFEVPSTDIANLFCLDTRAVTINGTRRSDVLLSESPVWSYTNERNITYKPDTGNLIMDGVSLRLGGQTINELSGEYICLDQDLSVPDENQIGLVALTGKNDIQLVTRPKTYIAKMPLFNMLPICALRHHDFEVQVDLADFRNLVTFKGLGIEDPTSQSVITSTLDVSTGSRPLFVSPNTLFTNGANVVSFNTASFSTLVQGVTGVLTNLCSNIYAYSGNQLRNISVPGTSVTIPGSVIGSDGLGVLYVFNQTSNIFTSFTETLGYSNSFPQNSRLVLPPGYATATVSYIDLNQARLRTVQVPLVLKSQLTNTTLSIIQFYTSSGDSLVRPTVQYVTDFKWDADYNANCYFSQSHTNQPQLGTLLTSNTSALPSSQTPFTWTTNGFTFPGTYVTPAYKADSQGRGVANVYYTGQFVESFRYTSVTDPYGTVVSNRDLVGTYRYCKSTTGAWKTIRSSNLATYDVYRAVQSIESPCANVLVGYQGTRFIGTGTQALVTYYRYDGSLIQVTVTPSDTYIDPPSTYTGPDGTVYTLGGTTTCTFTGSEIRFNGPLPIYSVQVNSVYLPHQPIYGVTSPRVFNPGLTVTVDGSPYTVKAGVSEWVTDRLYVSDGTFYGLGNINGQNETLTTTSNIRALMDQGLVILSDSTPWKSNLNKDRVYYTGAYWELPSNIWPTTMSISFYDTSNRATVVEARPEEFGARLVSSGFGTVSYAQSVTGTWTLQNAAFATCYDRRSRDFLGLGQNQVVPITYYTAPRVLLSVGGASNYPFFSPISNVSIETCTDGQGRVYTGSQTDDYLIQVTANTVAAFDYTGALTPNRQILAGHRSFFTSTTDGTTVYWVTRDGTILSYNSSLEFGTDGSIVVLASNVASGVFSVIATNKHVVLSTSSEERLYFVSKATGQVTPVPIDRSSGILSWDGARYLTVFDSTSPSRSVLQFDTLMYDPPMALPLSIMVEYAVLSDDERRLFSDSDHNHLFKQIQVEEFVVKAGLSEVQFEVRFKNLVTELFFTMDGTPRDDFVAVAMDLNGYPLLDYDDAGSELALQKIQPYEHHSRIPDRAFWMYSFAKYPERMNPSGFINMSRIIDQIVSVRVNPSMSDRTIRVWATSYNMLKFRDGLCGLLY